jgi:hypothetical protein
LSLRGRQAGFLGILALLATYAYMAQGGFYNQDAHYALVKSLAEGTPYIDQSLRPAGNQGQPRSNDRTAEPSSDSTRPIGPAVVREGDIAYFRGHAYAAKAPGLAFVALPAYLALRAVRPSTVEAPDDTSALWALGLFGVVLPSAILLLLVRKVADEIEPGYGMVAAVILGLCTLVLPFSTLFFAHILATTLGFAAFFLLRRELRVHDRLRFVAGAGACAGLAITADYTVALVAIVLAVYTFFHGRRRVEVLSFIAGALLGILPLLLYQWWAFGSMFHASYAGVPGNTGGWFGVGAPNWRIAGELLFSRIGLLRLSPVLVLGVVGAVFLYRKKRRDALVVLGLTSAFIVFNSAYATPFGGASPGPRFLIPILPFLAFPLVIVIRRLPLTTLSLAVPSAVLMLVVTATNPLSAVDGKWFSRLRDGEVTHTIVNHLLYPTAWLAVIPFFLGGVLAAALAARSAPVIRISRPDAITAAAGFTLWLVLASAGSMLSSGLLAALGVASTAAIAALALKAIARYEPRLPLSSSD